MFSSKFLLCVLALVMCSIVEETSAQYVGYASSSYYPSYYGGYAGYGGYGNVYGAYGLGSAYAGAYGYYGKRDAGFGGSPNQS